MALVCATVSSLWADHGVSAWGSLKYPASFTHFDYVNPKAPKGGHLNLGNVGTFDSLNPYIVRGTPGNVVVETSATLLAPSMDEINVGYGYVAQDVNVSADGMRVTYILHPHATFSDGTRITSQDVVFSYHTLIEKGMPFFKGYYADVAHVDAPDDHTVIFTLKHSKNREMPVILGQIPVLSKAFYSVHAFEKTSLQPPPSSGPYHITSVKGGHSLTAVRIKNWWGEHLPSQKGMHNFDAVTVSYYRDNNALFEAFKAGAIDVRMESMSKLWHTGYNFDAVSEGRVVRDTIKHKMCAGAYGLFLNTRRGHLSNVHVRRALIMLYDFEWANAHLFYASYKRNTSYFPNTAFSATPSISANEKALLKALGLLETDPRLQFLPLPVYSAPEDARTYQKEALNLFKKAGWALKNGKLVDKNNVPFSLNILIYDRAMERVYARYITTLKRLGVDAHIRFMDVSTYQERIENFDFDAVSLVLPISNSPGSEMREFFSSASKDQKGSYNYAGVHDDIIDKVLHKIAHAQTFDETTSAMRILDRLLLSGAYMIPAWHDDTVQLAYWRRVHRPKHDPLYIPFSFSTFWMAPVATNAVLEGDSKEDASRDILPDLEASFDLQSPSKTFSSVWERLTGWMGKLFKTHKEPDQKSMPSSLQKESSAEAKNMSESLPESLVQENQNTANAPNSQKRACTADTQEQCPLVVEKE